MENQRSSWKDEYWTILLSIPFIGSFIPAMQPHMVDGFKSLEQLPDWYLPMVSVAIAAAFGYRALAKPFISKTLGAKA